MKIVIDIPESIYETIEDDQFISRYQIAVLQSQIRKGVPLPKGHGRLIDADAYIDKHEECGWLDDITVDGFNTITPTIIEADKAGIEDV